MYLVPYYIRSKDGDTTKTIQVTVAWVFMKENGAKLWKTEHPNEKLETIVQEYFYENGFYGTVKKVTTDTLYFEVDTKKTMVDDYYRWLDDVDESTDIWRPWFFLPGGSMDFPEQIKVLRDDVMKQ